MGCCAGEFGNPQRCRRGGSAWVQDWISFDGGLCVGVLCAVHRYGEVARGVHALSGDVKRVSREGPGRMWARGEAAARADASFK